MTTTAWTTSTLGRAARVVIVTRSNPLTRSVVARLHNIMPLRGVVVEGSRPASPLAANVAGVGALRRLVRRALRVARRPWNNVDVVADLAGRAIHEYHLEVGGAVAGWPTGLPAFETDALNGEPVIEWCRSLEPDIVVLLGCSIVRQSLIDVAGCATVNVHPSLLPEYRGWFSELWMVLEQRLEHAGITLHLVDEGVDTGDILLQRPLIVSPGIDPFSLQAAGAVLVPELVAEVVASIADGRVQPRSQDLRRGRTYRRRDLTPEMVEQLRGLCRASINDRATRPTSYPSTRSRN